MDKGILIVILFLLCISFAAAPPNAPTGTTVVGSSTRNLSQLPAQSISAQGGNVTEVNVFSITVTRSWQGVYGNLTGMIALQDATNSTFYNWTLTSFNGRVFATRAATVNWTGVNCTNSTNRTSEETYLGQVAADSDSVTNTFNLTTHPAVAVGTLTIPANSCFATNGYVANQSQSSNFTMILLSHSNGQVIYTALTNKSVVGFDGKQHDFQLLIAENEKSGSIGATPYYFWTEFT